MDTELAARIGIIGLLFKKVVHRHVFSINYQDNFGDKQFIVNFSDSQYVNSCLWHLVAICTDEFEMEEPRVSSSYFSH